MDPYCDSRRDRYRLEPVEAAMENPSRYMREVVRPLYAAAERVAPITRRPRLGFWGEEEGGNSAGHELLWMLDPIDGMVRYLSTRPPALRRVA
jgi:hypothetical protein